MMALILGMPGATALAQKITTALGLWSNPPIWDPPGVPASTDDVTIAHEVVASGNTAATATRVDVTDLSSRWSVSTLQTLSTRDWMELN